MTTEKISQRQDQYDRGRHLFLETAKKLFKSEGFDRTKISDIVKASGKNVSTLYHYFPNGKTDLFKALLLTDIKAEFDKLEKMMMPDTDQPVVEALHAVYHQFVHIFYTNWYLMSIMFYYKSEFSEEMSPITRAGTDHIRSLLAEYLKQKVAQKELYIPDCDVAAKLFFAPGMEAMVVNFSEPEKDVYDTSQIDALIATWQRDTIFFDQPKS
ncbi:TetR/AcrR family transcriptional regulator [Secundilactobacillus folii]|uniref:TetR family transcriptional regulator n=1 Tax=Secundilactobacillus folii TaxID=2678357 RepID=A0A7X2XYL7_9LACO|nr:TetR/AcrR family transcriptional regulator [Secundilactobacillus folii]MTV82731.1 TetR family transcriptional regulator [Secundilactobacillus folii]